jgi:hypothetical protein
MGVIALFVALGGTSYAATQLPAGSVGAKQIRGGAVTARKIHSGAVTPSKLSRALSNELQSLRRRAAGKTAPTAGANAPGPGTAVVAYGYYNEPQPCIPAPGMACPQLLVVGGLSRVVNVSLADPGNAAGSGIVCLVPGSGIDPSSAVVVTSPVNGPSGEAILAMDHADWIVGAPNCPAGQLEVDTYYVTVDGSGQHVTRRGLPFAFAIL